MANPNGKKGSEKHQEVQESELLKTRKEYDKKLEVRVKKEVNILTPDGKKSIRVADVVAFSWVEKVINYYKIIQIGKTNQDGTPVKREQEAIEDIEKHTEIKVTFVDYTNYKLEDDGQTD